MIYTQIRPHSDLADYIDTFWMIEGLGQQLKKQCILVILFDIDPLFCFKLTPHSVPN